MPQQLTPKLYDPRWLIPLVKAALIFFPTTFTLVALKSDLFCRESKKEKWKFVSVWNILEQLAVASVHMLTKLMMWLPTCGLLLGGDLHTGAEGAIASLAEGPYLEHVGGAGLEVVDSGRGGLRPDSGVDALLLVLKKERE